MQTESESIKKRIVFLHGFTGSSGDWHRVIEKLNDVCEAAAVDLAGHGTDAPPDDPAEYTIDAQTERIASLMDEKGIETFVLAGYSMGGRLALNFALRFPERVEGLILESATAGIADERERENRRSSDEELIRFIETSGVEAFIEWWMNIPLFESRKNLPPAVIEDMRRKKLSNTPKGLAYSLREAGTGAMHPLWDELHRIGVPTLIITGSLDRKFETLGRQMAERIADARHVVIGDAGHTVHLERVDEYCDCIRSFIAGEFPPAGGTTG
jgi:2-succinyl-6-hydroxy-2,4-cyclohexadiene-1-carboxylate synthase